MFASKQKMIDYMTNIVQLKDAIIVDDTIDNVDAIDKVATDLRIDGMVAFQGQIFASYSVDSLNESMKTIF